MQYPPLKRHVSLQPFSREHFGGLVQARRLQEAAAGAAEDRRRKVADFERLWRAELAGHFDDEERLLRGLMDAEQRRRLLEEHREIRGLVATVEGAGDASEIEPDVLRRLGQLLHDHIRWEERVLFPAIEQAADAEQLKVLGVATAAIETQRPGAARRAKRPPD